MASAKVARDRAQGNVNPSLGRCNLTSEEYEAVSMDLERIEGLVQLARQGNTFDDDLAMLTFFAMVEDRTKRIEKMLTEAADRDRGEHARGARHRSCA